MGIPVVSQRLGVGIVGSGFMARFHVLSWVGVRDADIVAICSSNIQTATALADLCRQLGVGDPRVYSDPAAMARDPQVDAIWIAAPNYARIPVVEAICAEVASGRAHLKGLAMEKPLARNVREARHLLRVVQEAGLLHGYLENQVFAPALQRGKEILWRRGARITGDPYLARCAEEHSGPHRPWFWSGEQQGGGVLNDMMCHSLEAGRHLLAPERPGDFLRPRAVTARIASLKWTRPAYADRLLTQSGGQVDYRRAPAEDYATAEVVYENAQGELVVSQASTSWSYVGPGLRLTFEVLGPEYSMMVNTLDSGAQIFFSRAVQGPEGEDLVEKQNAEQGLMPYLPDEPGVYGYTEENRHMVQAFLRGQAPRETWEDGLLVTELLMACYLSSELGETIAFPVPDLESYVPSVAAGRWDPRSLVEVARPAHPSEVSRRRDA